VATTGNPAAGVPARAPPRPSANINFTASAWDQWALALGERNDPAKAEPIHDLAPDANRGLEAVVPSVGAWSIMRTSAPAASLPARCQRIHFVMSSPDQS
jgi:hypothetical protein